MFRYSFEEVNQIAEKLNFNRNMVEKTLRLLTVLKHIERRGLSEKLVLKGGTAINLFMLELPRLSVDIDFDFCLNLTKEEMLKERKMMDEEIRTFMSSDGYYLSEKSRFSHSLYSYIYSYETVANSRDVLKIEINYSDRVHILKPLTCSSTLKLPEHTNVKRLSDEELIGSKLSALLTRTTPRDIYDAFNILQLPYDWELVKRITIFYTCLGSDIPISFSGILNDALMKIRNLKYQRVKETLIPVLSERKHFDLDGMKESVCQFIEKIFILNGEEYLFIDNFNLKKFNPSILFDGKSVEDVSAHPMGLWKTK